MASFVEKEDSSKTVTEIRNDLICQICENRARPGETKWYRCMNLHQICEECKNWTDECLCGQPITTEHDKLTEHLLSLQELKLICAYTRNGCREAFDENATLEDHESECLYRLVPCLAAPKCSEKVTVSNVIQHYEKHHGKLPEVKRNFRIVFGEKHYRFPVRFCAKKGNNETFILKLKDDGGVKNYWVYFLASPEKAKNFTYRLKFFGPKAVKPTLTYFEGKVVAAIDESFETLLEAGKCYSIPRKDFDAQIMDVEQNKYVMSVMIKKIRKKEEVKDENYESGMSDDEAT